MHEFWPLKLPSKNSGVHWDLTPKVGTHLGVWGFIPSHFLKLPGAWNVTPKLHSWAEPLKALALVVSPRLGLRQVGHNLWRFQAHFWLHGLNRKQHRVLGFYSTREDKFECVSTIQKNVVQIGRLVHGGMPHVASFAFVWSNGIVWQCFWISCAITKCQIWKNKIPWFSHFFTQAKGIDGVFYTTYTWKRKSKHLGTTHSFHMNKRKPNYTWIFSRLHDWHNLGRYITYEGGFELNENHQTPTYCWSRSFWQHKNQKQVVFNIQWHCGNQRAPCISTIKTSKTKKKKIKF